MGFLVLGTDQGLGFGIFNSGPIRARVSDCWFFLQMPTSSNFNVGDVMHLKTKLFELSFKPLANNCEQEYVGVLRFRWAQTSTQRSTASTVRLEALADCSD